MYEGSQPQFLIPSQYAYDETLYVGSTRVKWIARIPYSNNPNELQNYTETYQYDAVGNILKMAHHGGIASPSNPAHWTRNYQYALDSNRLLATSKRGDSDVTSHYVNPADITLSQPYHYDTHGSMLALDKTPIEYQMHWDYRDMIHHVNLGGDGSQVFYNYDSQKQRTRKRIEKNDENIVEERFYLGGMELYRRTENGSVVEQIETYHLFADDDRVLMVENVLVADSGELPQGVLYRFQYGNHLGSVGLELDVDAEVISYEEYHPYGTTAYSARNKDIKAVAKRYRYTGMERDEETGLSYHTARYYLPWLGRWGSVDPIGVGDGLNLYRYVRNNPPSWDDPSGLSIKILGTKVYDAQNQRRDPHQITNQVARNAGGRDLFMGMSEAEANLFQVNGQGYVILNPSATEAQLLGLSDQGKTLKNLIEDNDQEYVIHPLVIEDAAAPAWVQRAIASRSIRNGNATLKVTSEENGGEEYSINIRSGAVAAVAARGASGLTLVSPERLEASERSCRSSAFCVSGLSAQTSDPSVFSSRINAETHIFYTTGSHTDSMSTILVNAMVNPPSVQSIQKSRSGAVWHELGGHAELSRRGLPYRHLNSRFHNDRVERNINSIQREAEENAQRRTASTNE